MTAFSKTNRDRFESIAKRDFKTALIRLLEQEYKVMGSRRVLAMLADDLEQLHQEYFVQHDRLSFGDIVWQTTKDDGQRPSYGKRTEDYGVQTVILPLTGRKIWNVGSTSRREKRTRTIDTGRRATLSRWCDSSESAKSQGGLLSGAELAVLMNWSLHTIGQCLKAHFTRTS